MLLPHSTISINQFIVHLYHFVVCIDTHLVPGCETQWM